jgi:hypothetical protein
MVGVRTLYLEKVHCIRLEAWWFGRMHIRIIPITYSSPPTYLPRELNSLIAKKISARSFAIRVTELVRCETSMLELPLPRRPNCTALHCLLLISSHHISYPAHRYRSACFYASHVSTHRHIPPRPLRSTVQDTVEVK